MMKKVCWLLIAFFMGSFVYGQNTAMNTSAKMPKIIFIELGSNRCVPCKQMQPIMKSIQKKYGDQIQVVFYDVWEDNQKQYAEQYKVRLIPTQVFTDGQGKELYRHEGFLPEKEIDKFLKGKGLVLKAGQ